MNNNDLAEKIASDAGLAKNDARKLVDGVLAAIVDAVASGEEVSLAGFGKFKRKESAARAGRNPTTGLLIAKDDTILYEHYQYARTDRDRFLSQSMAKTITAMLIGIASDT